jgi:hypothetical protein
MCIQGDRYSYRCMNISIPVQMWHFPLGSERFGWLMCTRRSSQAFHSHSKAQCRMRVSNQRCLYVCVKIYFNGWKLRIYTYQLREE